MFPPRIAPYPSATLRQKILPSEWDLCVESWLLLTQQYLLLPSSTFETHLADTSSLTEFLTSYVANNSTTEDATLKEPRRLRENTFSLIHRALKEITTLPPQLLDWDFLSRVSVTFQKSHSLRNLLPLVWEQRNLGESTSMRKSKLGFISLLERKKVEEKLEDRITQEMAFSKVCYYYAQFLMTGSDLLDAMVSAYDRFESPSLKSHLVALLHVCLISLTNEHKPCNSTLLDHLYSLKSTSIVKALIRSTPFLSKFKEHVTNQDGKSGRATLLLKDFATFRAGSKAHDSHRPTKAKGKRKAMNNIAQNVTGGLHVHKLSLVTQIQDLFPDLGSGFVVKLLDEYDDNAEQVTAHLLDDNLPQHLKQADRLVNFDFSNVHDLAPKLSRPTSPLPLPSRRNVHDNDDFDNLAVDASKLHIGRKNQDLTADSMLATERSSHQKAAILSALAAFDSDDDERDDTYDAEDVGGTVDNTFAGERADAMTDPNDETLFNAYRMTPELFSRDWDTRRGQPRAALKRETGMTDEAIEGWAIMLSREPKRLKHLKHIYERRNLSQQSNLEPISWRADSRREEGGDSTFAGNQNLNSSHGERFGRGGRGGRGGGGRGAVAGPANERDTQVARQRKDTNKGSRANHNRRDQRARKMARGGFPG